MRLNNVTFNTDTVELTSTPQIYPETSGTDPFHREPYIASFRALCGNFDATFIVIHTDPDEATEEINGLGAGVEYAQGTYTDEMDFVVMGDLNADGAYYDEAGTSTLQVGGIKVDAREKNQKNYDYGMFGLVRIIPWRFESVILKASLIVE